MDSPMTDQAEDLAVMLAIGLLAGTMLGMYIMSVTVRDDLPDPIEGWCGNCKDHATLEHEEGTNNLISQCCGAVSNAYDDQGPS